MIPRQPPVTAGRSPRRVGPFAQPPELGVRLESRGLLRADELPSIAVDLQAINEDLPSPSALATERVSNTEVLRERIEVMRVGFESPELTTSPITISPKFDTLAHRTALVMGARSV